MNYRELKEDQQQRFNAFPIGFAFSKEQLESEMQRLGVTDTAELIRIGGGGFIRTADKEAYIRLCNSFDEELRAAIAADHDGSGFIADMFESELSNHEYIITGDLRDTFDALGLTAEEVNQDKRLMNGLQIALEEYRKNVII
mgnify:CR=1 FL=1